jgi:predicted dithiol-disulfide oxidoreductase (DUF899 family)
MITQEIAHPRIVSRDEWLGERKALLDHEDAYSLLDTTPYGRQEDFEDSPPGWPQKPTYG